MDHKTNKPSRSATIVVFLLVLQLFILGMSFSGYDTISIFCTVPDSPSAHWVGCTLHTPCYYPLE